MMINEVNKLCSLELNEFAVQSSMDNDARFSPGIHCRPICHISVLIRHAVNAKSERNSAWWNH